MKNGDTFTINLRIGSIMFPITLKREDEEAYRAAEKLINERLNYYSQQYIGQDNNTLMCMALLDMALKLKLSDFRNDTEPFVNSMNTLLGEVEEALKVKKGV